LLHDDRALRNRVVAATALSYDPDREYPWFFCACHLTEDCIVPGQRARSWVLAPGAVPLSSGQMREQAAPVTLLPEERAAADGRFEELALVLKEQDGMKTAHKCEMAALLCVCAVLVCCCRISRFHWYSAELESAKRENALLVKKSSVAEEKTVTLTTTLRETKAQLREVRAKLDVNEAIFAKAQADALELRRRVDRKSVV
jgi:hypothetical protein